MNWIKFLKLSNRDDEQNLNQFIFFQHRHRQFAVVSNKLFMKTLKTFFETKDHYEGVVVPLTLALVILPHGCQLLFGWFNGIGYQAAMNYFTQVENLPWIIGLMVILLQTLGALCILIGLAGRLMAMGMMVLFIGMILTSHLDHGFFMNWFGQQKGEGYEYHLLVIGLCLTLLISGSGTKSLDYYLTRNILFN